MFELISGDRPRVPRRDTMPMIISSAAHAVVIGAVAAVPLLYMGTELPEIPQVIAFVAMAPPPPAPPPPPPAAPAAKPDTRPRPKPVVTSVARPVPIEPPIEILPESADTETAGEEGISGGVEGGVPGGIVGGFLASTIIPPPPPVAPPPVTRDPVRVGGAITAPAIQTRVDPLYPPLAAKAHIQGVVILEAVVGRDGRVENVKVLRSIPLLDTAAIEAVQQWRYSPLLLNGTPERFVVTVTLTFNLNT